MCKRHCRYVTRAIVHCTEKPSTVPKKAIRGAKTDYRRKFEGKFLSNDTRSVWQGLQFITGYKQNHSIPGFESATPDNFNNFYARFDRQNLTPTSVSLPDPAVPLPPPSTLHCSRARGEETTQATEQQESSWTGQRFHINFEILR